MAKERKYELVLGVLREAANKAAPGGPGLVSFAQFEDVLGLDCGLKARLPSWIWDVKNKAGVPVEREMKGREVVGWFIPKPLVPVIPLEDVVGAVASDDEKSD